MNKKQKKIAVGAGIGSTVGLGVFFLAPIVRWKREGVWAEPEHAYVYVTPFEYLKQIIKKKKRR